MVAVLFIDLVGSTQLTSTHEPHELAVVLNEFFQIVVAAVDERARSDQTSFQGDAALAVFGRTSAHGRSPRRRALATRTGTGHRLAPTRRRLRHRGVSAGPVFAGNIGAENRYEYTVVGDAVNEAARLAEPGQGIRRPGAVFLRRDRPRRRGGATVLGRAGLGNVARQVAAHADLGCPTREA